MRTDRILSPAIIYENGRYRCGLSTVKEILFYTVKVKMVSLDNSSTIQLKYPSDRLRSWHLDVIHTEKGYEMLVVAFYKGHRHREMNLYYTSSKNEHDFKKCITILKPSEKEKAWDNRGIYRSSFFCGKWNLLYLLQWYWISKRTKQLSQGVGLHIVHRVKKHS